MNIYDEYPNNFSYSWGYFGKYENDTKIHETERITEELIPSKYE